MRKAWPFHTSTSPYMLGRGRAHSRTWPNTHSRSEARKYTLYDRHVHVQICEQLPGIAIWMVRWPTGRHRYSTLFHQQALWAYTVLGAQEFR